MIITAKVQAHVLLTHEGIAEGEFGIARNRLLEQLNRVPQGLVFWRLGRRAAAGTDHGP